MARKPARAEVVGSLLRPSELHRAVQTAYKPGHTALQPAERAKDLSHLREVEDETIREVVARQIGIGLDVVTDGEFRRYMFLNSFYDAVEGFSTEHKQVEFKDAQGRKAVLNVHRVEDRLRKVDSPAAREAAFLDSITTHPFKVTFPAASIFVHPFSFEPGVTDRAYCDLDELVSHMVSIEQALISEAVEAGARYIQLDFPLYPYLVDTQWVERFQQAGFALPDLLDGAIAADRAVLEGIPPEVTVALHVCRGNYRSRWMCEGSLEPVAERIFSELPYDVFLIEWDDIGRDGGYEPIRFLPSGRVMVMGVVNTKTNVLESEDEVLRRMDQASRYLGLEQLAISPQCGFASVVEGNEIDDETQWAKLELVARVAHRLWT